MIFLSSSEFTLKKRRLWVISFKHTIFNTAVNYLQHANKFNVIIALILDCGQYTLGELPI